MGGNVVWRLCFLLLTVAIQLSCSERSMNTAQNGNEKQERGLEATQFYRWLVKPWTDCSVSCGSGWKSQEVVCVVSQSTETHTFAETNSSNCLNTTRPDRERSPCHQIRCPSNATARWLKGKFTTCNATCGGGYSHRPVRCYRDNHLMDDAECVAAGRKPRSQKRCNRRPCSVRWTTGDWTPCSSDCGWGVRKRDVSCTVVYSTFGRRGRIPIRPGVKPSFLSAVRTPCDEKSIPVWSELCQSSASCNRVLEEVSGTDNTDMDIEHMANDIGGVSSSKRST